MIRIPKCLPALLLWLGAAVSLPAQLTESPQPIGPGSVLFEIDGLRLGFDRNAPEGHKYEAIAIASTVVSLGLTENIDLQIGADVFLRERIEANGSHTSHSGLGDLSFRTKWRFWQGESGGAAAIIPYARVPTGTGGVGSESVEGGFILPWETSLPAGVLAGTMLQWDVVRNPDDNGYDSRWLLSGYLHRSLTSTLGAYAEAALEAASTGGSDTSGSLGIGAVWMLSPRLALDYELMRGLNRAATDWTHTLRLNWSW